MAKISPLAPARGFPSIPPIAGVELAAGSWAGGETNLMLAHLAPGTRVAGVLTRSLTASAPIDWCREILPQGGARALVVNSGNANAFTGGAGDVTLERTVQAAAGLFDCPASQVFVASTGVIGEPLDGAAIAAQLPALKRGLGSDWRRAAEAIMTTDTYPKGAWRKARLAGTEVTIAGIAKGSGMIAPDLGTMLGFVFTDAALPADLLQKLVVRAADRSFNCITVDSDTSTSDTLLLFATGKAGNAPLSDAGGRGLGDFRRALEDLMGDLARQVVRDGEGASKFITIAVSGAKSRRAAQRIGLAIGNSPLVKTAVAGEDANWGRIVMAVGKSGERADRDRLSITIGGSLIAERGGVVAGYDEAPVAAHMQGDEILIEVDVGAGRGKATVWTCDLTHDYIAINADYRS